MTVEELINKIAGYENMDNTLILGGTEDGGVCIMNYEGKFEVKAPTLKQALREYWDLVKHNYED